MGQLAGIFFHVGPADLTREDFVSRRKGSFEQCFARLADGSYRERILANYRAKQGTTNPFVIWPVITEELLSRALDNMEVLTDYRTAIISLSEADLREFNYQKGDTEGFVNYGLSMEGIEVSAFIYEKDGKVKMSFRSKTDFDVNTFAREHFNGGGHLNAAGALSDHKLEETRSRLKEILKHEARDRLISFLSHHRIFFLCRMALINKEFLILIYLQKSEKILSED